MLFPETLLYILFPNFLPVHGRSLFSFSGKLLRLEKFSQFAYNLFPLLARIFHAAIEKINAGSQPGMGRGMCAIGDGEAQATGGVTGGRVDLYPFLRPCYLVPADRSIADDALPVPENRSIDAAYCQSHFDARAPERRQRASLS